MNKHEQLLKKRFSTYKSTLLSIIVISLIGLVLVRMPEWLGFHSEVLNLVLIVVLAAVYACSIMIYSVFQIQEKKKLKNGRLWVYVEAASLMILVVAFAIAGGLISLGMITILFALNVAAAIIAIPVYTLAFILFLIIYKNKIK